ncbi:MAG TPA: DUF4190 domain-containing protein [Gemmataceae bacterium]|nr:DUF4190 domain-containing protein [Gemmataceae bacterium]
MTRRSDDFDDYDDEWDDARHLKPHRGLAVLLLGIFGLKTCGLLGIVAFFMGRNDLAEMDAGRMDPSGRGMTQAGYIIGIVSVVLFLIAIGFVTLYIVAIAALH